tara:strand:- start:157 stop:1836 length:1680 start_codon:yes stop_codon:yes gene_type:complete
MIHIIKNYKWVIATSLICILFGLLTFFTFTNQSFITLKDFNLQILLIIDLILLTLFFGLITYEAYKTFKRKREKKLGSEVNFKYILYFSSTTLLPSIIIAVFSLILFNVGMQRYFDDKIKSVVNNSAELANNYVEQTRNSIETDILLIILDIENKASLFYDNPNRFQKLLTSQRLLRRLDEIHLIDSSSNLIMSNIVDPSINFIPPPDEAFERSLSGKPVRIIDSRSNRSSALVKLTNYIDTYLYIVRFLDPRVINYLKETGDAVSFYYTVQESKTGIKLTFGIIYLLVVTLFIFLSIIISINFASRLTIPIINLIKASEKISTGDLNAKVPRIETDDELKKLNENFNSMIDKLKKQQDKLLLSERHLAWESVARKLAHEIKNPLTPIQLSIDRIKEKYLNQINDKDKNFSEYLNTITKQIRDIELLVNEFSDFARMPKPVFKKIDLSKLISRSIDLHKLSEKNINFNLVSKKNRTEINVDEEQLNRVFINLIKNSIESIKEKIIKNVDFKGKINIDIKEDNTYIFVKITDNGIGFGKVNKTKMLTPYFTTKKMGQVWV